MLTDHPELAAIDLLLSGQLPAPEIPRLIAHFLGCGLCAAHARGHIARGGWARPDGSRDQPATDYGSAFELSRQGSLRDGSSHLKERLRSSALWARLAGKSQSQRLRLIETDLQFHSWALASHLLETSADSRWRAPQRSLDSAHLALAILNRLPVTDYPGGLLEDFRARPLATLADALRLNEDFGAGAATLKAAWEVLDQGTGDPLERAGLLHVQANLSLSLGEFGEAANLLRSAASIFRLYHDPHQEGRILQKLALATGYIDPAHGVALAGRALALIDPIRQPRLDLGIRHVLIWFLNDSGLAAEALAVLERSRPLYRQFEGSQPRLSLPWLEARICRTLNSLEMAERILVAVWHDYRMSGFQQDLTLVSLDLVETYLAQGKIRHAIRLLRTFRAILTKCRMHTEGIAAWLLLEEVTRTQPPRAQALSREAVLYFRQAWRRPMPFRPNS